MDVKTRQTAKLLTLLMVLFLVISCMGKTPIVVDTTGMTPEQIEAVQWKVKYAVALDWYDWEQKSYKASLDALPLEKAKEIHNDAKPLWEAADTTLAAFRAAVYAQNPDPMQQDEAYQAYLTAKSALLATLVKLLD